MRVAVYSLLLLGLGCGEPLVVPVDLTMGEGRVAQSTGGGGGDSDQGGSRDASGEAADDRADGAADGGRGARTDGGRAADGGEPRAAYTCIDLPDPVIAAAMGDAGLPHTDVVRIATDEVLGCEAPPPPDGGLDMGPMLHGNYERLDGEPILRAGKRYALAAAPVMAPLDVHVLVARIISGDAPCDESELLGSIAITQPFVNGACTDLDPGSDARFLRLPVELSALFVSAPLRLCDVPCSEL